MIVSKVAFDIRKYLENCAILSAEELDELRAKIRQQGMTPELRELAFRSQIPLVVRVCGRLGLKRNLAAHYQTMCDTITELWVKLKHYDPERAALSTFAWTVSQRAYLRMYYRHCSRVAKQPDSTVTMRHALSQADARWGESEERAKDAAKVSGVPEECAIALAALERQVHTIGGIDDAETNGYAVHVEATMDLSATYQRLSEALRKAIDDSRTLSPKYKQVLTGRIAGQKVKEIADDMQVSKQRIAEIWKRAVPQLCEEIQGNPQRYDDLVTAHDIFRLLEEQNDRVSYRREYAA